MACSLTTGRGIGCKSNVGGIQNVYFGDPAEFTASSVTYDNTTGEIENTGMATGNASIFKFALKGANSFTTTITGSDENGTVFTEQSLAITLQTMDHATLKEIKLLAHSRPKIFVEDRNGNLLMLGIENGMTLTTGTIVSGDAMGDLSGYTLEFSGQEKIGVIHVDGGIANASFVAGLATTSITPATTNE